MKRFFSIFALAAMSIAAFVGCEPEQPAPEVIELKSIEVAPTTLNLVVGNTANLTVTYKPENATETPEIEWSSSNPKVATVEAAKVTAVAEGEATITAKAGALTATVAVTVSKETHPAESITLSKTVLNLEVGATETIVATVKPDNSTDQVVWTTSAEAVATVENGVVTAVAVGNATITATAGSVKAEAAVTVSAVPVEVPKGLASIYDQIKDASSSANATDYAVTVENAVVTYVNGGNAYLKDATGYILYYKNNHGLEPGTVLNGKLSGKGYMYHGLPEVTGIGEEVTTAAGTVPEPEEVTLAELAGAENYTALLSKYVIVKGVKVETAFASRNAKVSQNGTEFTLYDSKRNLEIKEGATGNLTAIVGIYDANKQLLFWQNDWFVEDETPADPEAEGLYVLDLNNPDLYSNVEFGAGDAFNQLSNYTFEVRFLSRNWAKVQQGVSRRLMQIHNGSENENIMLRFGDGNTAAGVLQLCGRTNNNVNITDHVFAANEWITLTVTGDGSTVRVYDNGTEIYSAASNRVLTPKAIEFGMSWDDGSGWPAKQVFDGLLDYVRIWNVTRSASEIKAGLCSVDANAEGLLANFVFEGKTKPAAVKDEAHNLTLDFANSYRDRSGGKDVDLTDIVKGQWTDYTGTICVPVEPEDPEITFVKGTAPVFNQRHFSVTFPQELDGSDALTLEGWIYPTSWAGAQANLPNFMGTENSINIRFNQNGVPDFLLGDPMTGSGEIHAQNTSFRLATNQWYHVAGTYTRNGEMILYVNAEEVARTNTRDYPVSLNSGVLEGRTDDSAIGRHFYIGNAYSTRWFSGNMNYLRVWNKALSQEEIKASANNKDLKTADGLIANWPLLEGEGLTIHDISGNKINATAGTVSGNAPVDAESLEWASGLNVPDLIFAESLKLNETSLSLMRGDIKTLVASVEPANALVPTITWSTTDANVASVADGVVTAKTVGSATITAKATVAGKEISANCEVTVNPLSGAVAPNMKQNYIRTLGGYGNLADVTVEWKMKADSWSPTVNSVFGREGQWLLRIGDEGIGANELQLATNHGNWTTGVTFETGKWYHVAVTYSTASKAAQVYVNGKLAAVNDEFATAAANLTGSTSTNNNQIGNDVKIGASYMDGNYWSGYTNNRWFDGQLCEFRVWSTVRTEEEINMNLNNLEDTSSENLKAYYKMDIDDANNGNGNTVKDYSPAGKNLTAASAILWAGGREDVTPEGQGAIEFGPVEITKSTVGAEDNTSLFWGDHSQNFDIPEGSRLQLVYKNYSSKAEFYNNWILVLANQGLGTDGYSAESEYLVLRSDNYGWGSKYVEANLWSALNWDFFKDGMDGATVTLDVQYAKGEVAVTAVSKGSNGITFPETYHFALTGEKLVAFLTVDNSHLVLQSATLLKPSDIEGSDVPDYDPVEGFQW